MRFVLLASILLCGCSYNKQYEQLENSVHDYKMAVLRDQTEFLVRDKKQDMRMDRIEAKLDKLLEESE